MIKSAQSVTVDFTTVSPVTGAATDATGTPVGTLVVNGTDNGASVTVTNKATGVYKAAVTLPSLDAGDVVQLRIAATVAGIDGAGVVWVESIDETPSVSTSTTDSTTAGAITRMRGNSWSISLTIGTITGYTSLWFTAKWDRDDPDISSVIQIKLNSPSASDGLLYVNGAAASDSTKGSITVSDASTGAIIIAVDETVTDDMPAGAFYYDVQVLNSGAVTTPDSGTFTITADVTRSVT